MTHRNRLVTASWLRTLLAMVVWLCAVRIPAQAQPPEPSCRQCQTPGIPCRLSFGASGRVTDRTTGLPVAGAEVRVAGVDPVFTDARGFYFANTSRLDTCTLDYEVSLTVAADGFASFSQRAYFSAVALPVVLDVVLDADRPVVFLGSAVAAPGSTTPIAATLNAAAAEVARIEQEIGFDRTTPIAADENGNPACHAGAGIGEDAVSFEFLPGGCSPLVDCSGLRTVVDTGASPLADGAVLYECAVFVSPEEADTCAHDLACPRVSARAADGTDLPASCVGGRVVSEFAAAGLVFSFNATPENPRVGEQVTLRVAVGGAGGLPQYSLSGAAPFLDGDTSPISHSMFGEVTYGLTAVRAGTAELTMRVNYETAHGCPGNQFFSFTSDVSEPFLLAIGGAVSGACAGDCDGDARVLVDEVVTCVNVGLGHLPGDTCAACDADGDGNVGIGEIVQAVNIGLGHQECAAQ